MGQVNSISVGIMQQHNDTSNTTAGSRAIHRFLHPLYHNSVCWLTDGSFCGTLCNNWITVFHYSGLIPMYQKMKLIGHDVPQSAFLYSNNILWSTNLWNHMMICLLKFTHAEPALASVMLQAKFGALQPHLIKSFFSF